MATVFYLPYTLVLGDGTTIQRVGPTVQELQAFPANGVDNVVLTQQFGSFASGAYQWNPIKQHWAFLYDYATLCAALFGIAQAYICVPNAGDTTLPIGTSGNATVKITRNGVPFSNYTLSSNGVELEAPAIEGDIFFVAQQSPLKPATLIVPGGISEAPNTGLAYVRQSSTWVTMSSTGVVTSVNDADPDTNGNVNIAIPSGADVVAKVGLTAISGSATTFMRSDAAPALDQTIAPTWTATHTFTSGIAVPSGSLVVSSGPVTLTGSSAVTVPTVVATDSSSNAASTAMVRAAIAGSGSAPTAKSGPTAVTGSAATFMTSDSAPAINTGSAYIWTGQHTFEQTPVTISAGEASSLKIQTTGGIAATFFANDATNTFGIFDASTGSTVLAFAKGTDVGTFSSSPFVTTLVPGTNNTQAASTAFVQTELSPYLTSAIAASTYVTIQSANNTYLTQANAALTYANQTGGVITGSFAFNAVNPANFRGMGIRTNNVSRWNIGSDVVESGSGNNGSDLRFYAYSDTGALLGNYMQISRATGVVTLSARPTFAGNTAVDTGNIASAMSPTLSAYLTTANAASTYAPIALTGSPHYVNTPYMRNAQLVGGVPILFAFIAPRAMTLTSAVCHVDTPPSATLSFLIYQNSTTGSPVASVNIFNSGSCSFSLTGAPPVLAAGDRLYIVNTNASNSIGPMDGYLVAFIFTLD